MLTSSAMIGIDSTPIEGFPYAKIEALLAEGFRFVIHFPNVESFELYLKYHPLLADFYHEDNKLQKSFVKTCFVCKNFSHPKLSKSILIYVLLRNLRIHSF